jgi:hypothetical protein
MRYQIGDKVKIQSKKGNGRLKYGADYCNGLYGIINKKENRERYYVDCGLMTGIYIFHEDDLVLQISTNKDAISLLRR